MLKGVRLAGLYNNIDSYKYLVFEIPTSFIYSWVGRVTPDNVPAYTLCKLDYYSKYSVNSIFTTCEDIRDEDVIEYMAGYQFSINQDIDLESFISKEHFLYFNPYSYQQIILALGKLYNLIRVSNTDRAVLDGSFEFKKFNFYEKDNIQYYFINSIDEYEYMVFNDGKYMIEEISSDDSNVKLELSCDTHDTVKSEDPKLSESLFKSNKKIVLNQNN